MQIKKCHVCNRTKRVGLFTDSWLMWEYRQLDICTACMRKGFKHINEKLKQNNKWNLVNKGRS